MNLERQVQLFQFKIQQKIALRDDELDRIAKELTLYKSGIAEANIRIHQLDRDIEATKYQVRGGRQCNQASLQARMARRKAEHSHAVRELDSQHALTVDDLHQQFAETIEQMRESHQSQLNEQLQALDDEKKGVEADILRYRESITEAEQAAETEEEDCSENGCFEGDDQMIGRLRDTIRARNAERVESLLNSKTKLTECLHVLETLDRDHERNVSEARKGIEAIDARYRDELAQLKQTEKSARSQLAQALRKAQKRLKQLQSARRTLQFRQREEMKTASLNIAMMEKEMASSAPIFLKDAVDGERLKKVERRRGNVAASRRMREAKEAKLFECRELNGNLKREVAEKKHRLRYVQRYNQICAIGISTVGRMA
jgi:chromosome segregation ATPase